METLIKRMKAEDGRPVLSEVEGMKEYVRTLLAAFADKESHPFGSAQDKPSAPQPQVDQPSAIN